MEQLYKQKVSKLLIKVAFNVNITHNGSCQNQNSCRQQKKAQQQEENCVSNKFVFERFQREACLISFAQFVLIFHNKCLDLFGEGIPDIIIQLMKGILFFLMTIIKLTSNQISATLRILQYEPTVFQLQFSESIALPQFQLILNNAKVLNYTILSESTPQTTFYIQAEPYSIPNNEILENYKLMFNYPLSIGSGRLSTQYFRIDAQKNGFEISQTQVWGIILIIAAYLLINFAFFGIILVQFLQVYCLISFRAQMHTDLNHQIGNGLFLLNPDFNNAADGFGVIIRLCVPPLAILTVGIIGFLVKRLVKDKTTVLRKLIYETFVYDLFICIGIIFVMPSFFNSIQYFNLVALGKVNISSSLKPLAQFFAYLGLVTSLSLLYLFFYMINPKIKESQQSWKKYLVSEKYESFRRLHDILKKGKWYARNMHTITVAKRLVIACLYFLPDKFQVAIFLLQFANIFYMFIVQPYKEEVYLNIKAICRLLMLIFYGIIVLGSLYYSIGKLMINYTVSVKPFLLAADTLYLIICLFLSFAIFYQMYIKCSNFNYHIKVVREENQIKLKIIERKNVSQNGETEKKYQSEFSQLDPDDKKYTQYLEQIRRRDPTALRRPTTIRKVSENKKRSNLTLDQHDSPSKNPSKYEKMIPNGPRFKAETIISHESNGSRTKKDKLRWKKESFLVQILKEK